MDLTFSEMSVDTSLAQEYLKKNETLLELYNDYNVTIEKYGPYAYNGKAFIKNANFNEFVEKPCHDSLQNTLLNLASKLEQNATLIMQLEYYIRNIPIEDTSTQLNLIIQYIRCHSKSSYDITWEKIYPDDPLLVFGHQIINVCKGACLAIGSKATAAICHLLVTLLYEAGAKNVVLQFVLPNSFSDERRESSKEAPVRGLNSGTVAVVSEDADVDSAVEKFIAVSMQAPWRLRRILVQESVYQQFNDALSWKCNLNKSGNKPLTSDVLCSNTLTYNDKTFLIDPVELIEEKPSVVTVEAYRTTKEMISLVQEFKARYLSFWTNGIALMNEVVHSTKSPVVWVNNVADFRGPRQVSEAVLFDYDHYNEIKKCDNVAKLCELLQSWLKLDLESRRDILYSSLDKCILLDPANKDYPDIKKSISACTLQSFVDVGKDYVCIGMSQPLGIVNMKTFFSVESFESLLHGNALIYITNRRSPPHLPHDLSILEQAGVPVAVCNGSDGFGVHVWSSNYHTTTPRIVWTNSGTIFAN